jgi:hypothetical protein
VARRDSSLRRINAVAIRVKRTESGEKSIMAKATTKLNAEDRVILFLRRNRHRPCSGRHSHACDAVHGGAGIHRAQSRNRVYALTDSGRATLTAILEDAGLK